MGITDYIAPDGGGRTKLDDNAILDGQATTANQNPVLFLAYMMRACGRTVDIIKASHLHHSIVSVGKGRLLRRKGDPLRQSHDNVLAWAWLAVVGDNPEWAKEIYDWAKWRFFVYDPHHTYSLDPRCILQGPTIFMLQLAANKKPGWITTVWTCGGWLVQDHASSAYLLSLLDTDILHSKIHLLSPLKRKVVFWAHDLMSKRREKAGRWYREYFHECPDHPMVLAAMEADK